MTDKTNMTLRLDKKLIEKWKGKINFSKFMEFCLLSLDGKDFYLNLKTGRLEK